MDSKYKQYAEKRNKKEGFLDSLPVALPVSIVLWVVILVLIF